MAVIIEPIIKNIRDTKVKIFWNQRALKSRKMMIDLNCLRGWNIYWIADEFLRKKSMTSF